MINSSRDNNRLAYSLMMVFTVLFIWLCFSKTGAGLSGDSIKHFLIAKYASEQSILFFDHWGKPIFTLLASPFTEFGFIGIKIFNIILALLSAIITYKISQVKDKNNSYLAILFTLSATYFFTRVFGGLTEYLSAFMLVLGIYWETKDKSALAATVLSFTPFVRSEGLILIGVFAFYYLLNNKHRPIIYLFIGHIAYSIVGYFWHYDILWVFTKIPYSDSSDVYGKGTFTHFFTKMKNIMSIPIMIFLILGLIKYIIDFLQTDKKYNYFKSKDSILIVGMSIAFFTAHTLFWGLGIFNSMGLQRVFITVSPLFCLIAVSGFNFGTTITSNHKINKAIYMLLLGYAVIFPFTPNNASIIHSMNTLEPVANHIQFETKIKPSLDMEKYTHFYASNPYFSYSLDYNLMNNKIAAQLDQNGLKKLSNETSKSLIIWDDWFSVVENNCQLEDLKNNHQLKFIDEIKEGNKIVLAVFETK